MASKTESKVPGDFIIHETDSRFCRETEVVLDGETFAVGAYGRLDSNSKMVVIAADSNVVQTITPTVGSNVDEVHTITTDLAFTAGDLAITVYAPDGSPIPVSVVFNASVAQTITDWNTKMTVAATVWAGGASVGAVLTSADAGVTMVLTFSGVGFTNNPIPHMSELDLDGLTTTTNATTVRTTAGSGVIGFGTWRIRFIDLNGDVKWTPQIAFDANAAAINVAIDAALGATLVVATGGPLSGPTAIVLTYSGTGYKEKAQALPMLDFTGIEGLSDLTVTQTTEANAAEFDGICLEKAEPSGSDGAAVFLVRGPAVVNVDQTELGTLVKALVVARLLEMDIVGRDEPATLALQTT